MTAKTVDTLLFPVGDTNAIPPSNQNFIAAQKLVVNTGPDAELKIIYLGENFKSGFLGKVRHLLLVHSSRFRNWTITHFISLS